MPLAPASLIDTWYKRSSWVHRSFSYLFQNPLWQKPVPQGFSLCPYFQLALFSLFLFRPLVLLVLGLRALVKVLKLGKALDAYETWFCGWSGLKAPTTGMPAVISLTMVTTAGLMVACVVKVVTEYVANDALSTLLLPVTLLGTLIACITYSGKHKWKEDRCPVEIYTRIVAVLCVVAAFLLQPDCAVESFVGYPVDLVTTVAAGIWFAIKWLAAGAWFCLSFVFHAGVAGFPIGIALIVALLIAGWAYQRFGFTFLENLDAPLPKEEVHPKLVKLRIDGILYSLWLKAETGISSTLWKRLAANYPPVIALAKTPGKVTDGAIATIQKGAGAYVDDRYAEHLAAIARRAAKCREVTAALLKVCAPITAVWKQVRILGSYLWELVKARKAGFCPYQRFHD